MGENRCVECGKFRPWEMLWVTYFTPDTPFGPEETEFTCYACTLASPETDKGETDAT